MKNIFCLLIILIFFQSVTAQQLQLKDNESAINFTINNFGIPTRGTLKELTGSIVWMQQQPSLSKIQATVQTETINTGITARDNHLKKESYFDIAKYPTIAIVSNSISLEKANTYIFEGSLTIKNKLQKISFPFTVQKTDKGFLFEGNFEINRRDFNVGGNSLSLADKVKVNLRVVISE
jgi:polyisoprenoid-binding protein YceI